MPSIQIAWNTISTNELEETFPLPYSPLKQSTPYTLKLSAHRNTGFNNYFQTIKYIS